MPGSNRSAYGNEIYDFIIAPTSVAGAAPGTLVWSSASLSSTTSELTATVPGLQVGDAVDLYLTTGALTTGLMISNVRVSAANTLAVTWIAATSALTIPTTGWMANVSRPETGALAGLPPNAL
jgi:hypothetical protein